MSDDKMEWKVDPEKLAQDQAEVDAMLLAFERGDSIDVAARRVIFTLGFISLDGTLSEKGKDAVIRAMRAEFAENQRLVRRLIDAGAALSSNLKGFADDKRVWSRTAGEVRVSMRLR